MADAARIQWIQYNELVLGENAPNGEPDNDNRPVKQICLFSNLNPQAADFPGFIGCYQGSGDPNGVQVGNVRNAFWAVDLGNFYMKQVGDNTNTGWVLIGGDSGDHLFGNGSPEGVAATSHNGKFYDQKDATFSNPTYVKRKIPVLTPYATEWFNGPDDTDIGTPARALDGGNVGVTQQHGTWVKPSYSTGTIDITSPGTPGISAAAPHSAAECIYYISGLALANNDCVAEIYFDYAENINDPTIFSDTNQRIGVGVRFSTSAFSGYLAVFDVGSGTFDGFLYLYKYVAGVATELANVYVNEWYGTYREHGMIQIRAIDTTIEVWMNSTRRISVTDTTYTAIGVPVIYFSNGKTNQTEPDLRIPVFTIYNAVAQSDTIGWFGENGAEYNKNIQLGTNSATNIWRGAGDIAIGYNAIASSATDSTGSNIAIGFDAVAVGELDAIAIGSESCFARGFGAIAIGGFCQSNKEFSTAIGFDSFANGNSSSAFGVSSLAARLSSIAIGDSAEADPAFSMAVGYSAFVNFALLFGLAVGSKAEVLHDNCIVIGHGAISSASNQLTIGGTQNFSFDPNEFPVATPSGGINTVLIGWGDTSTVSKAVTYRKTNASGSNVAGGDWTFIAGRGTGTGAPGNIIFQVATALGSGSTLQTATTRVTISPTGLDVVGALTATSIIAGRTVVTYSASMTPDASTGEIQEISATNGTAFTINAPTNPATGKKLTFVIRNTSGGALGVATWNAVFKMIAWVQPANGFSRNITFYYNGTNWVELNRAAADITN